MCISAPTLLFLGNNPVNSSYIILFLFLPFLCEQAPDNKVENKKQKQKLLVEREREQEKMPGLKFFLTGNR